MLTRPDYKALPPLVGALLPARPFVVQELPRSFCRGCHSPTSPRRLTGSPLQPAHPRRGPLPGRPDVHAMIWPLLSIAATAG
jgi:hypothetical protein